MTILRSWRVNGATIVILLPLLFGCMVPGTGSVDKRAGDNGSFEIVESGRPVNWVIGRYAIRDGDAEFSFDTGEAVDGKQSLKVVAHRVDDSSLQAPWLFRSRRAEPGQTYAVSFWLKSTACVLQIEIRNEGKDRFFGLSEAEKQDYAAHPRIRRVIGGSETSTDTWRQFRYVYKVPETDGSLRFELRILRPCTMWIDDVRIERVEGEPSSIPEITF